MIKNKSHKTGLMLEQKVMMDITDKGWIAIPTPAQHVADMIVDMGVIGGKRQFVTIQVKKSLRTTSRSSNSSEQVSKNGKDRNSYNYYDEDITYLATVNKHGRVVYYHKDIYKYMTPSKLNKANESVFPINDKIQGYRVSAEPIQNSALEAFLT